MKEVVLTFPAFCGAHVDLWGTCGFVGYNIQDQSVNFRCCPVGLSSAICAGKKVGVDLADILTVCADKVVYTTMEVLRF